MHTTNWTKTPTSGTHGGSFDVTPVLGAANITTGERAVTAVKLRVSVLATEKQMTLTFDPAEALALRDRLVDLLGAPDPMGVAVEWFSSDEFSAR